MFTTVTPQPTPTATSVPAPRNPWRHLGAAGMIATPLLLLGGGLTSPPQKSNSSRDYIASLAKDPTQSAISAQLYHYGWIALVLGAVASVGLARGRGRTLTFVGAAVTVIGAVQISGLLLSDYFNSAAGRLLTADQSAAVFEKVNDDPGVAVWYTSALLAIIGIPVLLAGLARARQLSWWLVPLTAAGFVVPFFLPSSIGATVGAICSLPIAWVGVLLLRNR